MSNALPSSLIAGPKPPSRLIEPVASLPIAAEPEQLRVEDQESLVRTLDRRLELAAGFDARPCGMGLAPGRRDPYAALDARDQPRVDQRGDDGPALRVEHAA